MAFEIYQNDENKTVIQLEKYGELFFLIVIGSDQHIESIIREVSKSDIDFFNLYIADDAANYHKQALDMVIDSDFENVTKYYFGNFQG